MKSSLFLTQLIVLTAVSASPIKTEVSKQHSKEDLVSILDITKVDQVSDDICVYDYSLNENFQDLPRPAWMESWDEVMPNTFCEHKYDIKVDPNANNEDSAKMLLFSLASGFAVDRWSTASLHKRFEGVDLEGMMDTLWETGDVPKSLLEVSPQEIEEQAGSMSLSKRTIFKHESNTHWIYAQENKARVSALNEVRSEMDRKSEDYIHAPKSALCATKDNSFGCLSWSGGSTRILGKAAAHTIAAGVGGHSDHDWISAKAHGALKRQFHNGVYFAYSTHNACLSNRREGCD
ncbi:hypothetical protein JCM33374_g6048 [Metschnikowia sp. JCM 33374]|nr:hypothetical protein JCM33374_g6048 [Metschnikowia sp. JCM 33374]